MPITLFTTVFYCTDSQFAVAIGNGDIKTIKELLAQDAVESQLLFDSIFKEAIVSVAIKLKLFELVLYSGMGLDVRTINTFCFNLVASDHDHRRREKYEAASRDNTLSGETTDRIVEVAVIHGSLSTL